MKFDTNSDMEQEEEALYYIIIPAIRMRFSKHRTIHFLLNLALLLIT